jgi:hypothetical protein
VAVSPAVDAVVSPVDVGAVVEPQEPIYKKIEGTSIIRSPIFEIAGKAVETRNGDKV